MKYWLFFIINFSIVGTAKPWVLDMVRAAVQCIIPTYAIKKAFDSSATNVPSGSATTTHSCPVTLSGDARAFIGCTVNGTLHMDGAGNTHTASVDSAGVAIRSVLGIKDDTRQGMVKKSITWCRSCIDAGASWVHNNKIITAAMTVGALYMYSWMRVAYCQRYIMGNSGWGAWHIDCNWEHLSEREEAQLREELLVEVRHRYPLVSDSVPVHCFMNDVDQEIAFYTAYMTLVARVQNLDKIRHFVTDRFRDAYIGLLGNTNSARVRGEHLFEYTALGRWLCVNEHAYALCLKKREHLLHLKAFYAEWLTTIRAIYKQKK